MSAGDILARADPSALDLSLAAAIDGRKSANITLRAASATLDDADANGTTAQIRQAKSGLLAAENQAAQAVQDVTDLRARIAAATLVAPTDGVVTELNVIVGFDAPAGSAIVIDASGFQVTTDVVESDLADVQVGQPATVSVTALGQDLTGFVSAISPVASTASGTGVVSYPVTVTVETPLPALRAGMSADVTITIASATNVLTVPAEALRGNAGSYTVLVLADDGTPASQPVEVGLVTATSAEITTGLADGQLVVTGIDAPATGTATATGGGFGGVAIPGGGFGGGRGTGGGGTGSVSHEPADHRAR